MQNNPTAIILALKYHVDDNWYGQNYRVVLSPDGIVGFNTITEAKKYRGAFVKYFNKNQGKTNKIKMKVADVKIGELGTFPTYIYCSAGPSYSCTNLYRTLNDIK
jgi:hypothetical protein